MGNYTAKTVKIIISGHFASGEEFAFGFQADGTNITGQSDLDQATTNLAGYIQNTSDNAWLKALISSGDKYEVVTAYKYSGGPTAELVSEADMTAVTGASAGQTLPLQCSMVATLLTGRPGRSYRGRMYLPATNATLSQGQFSSITDATAAGVAQLLGQVKNVAPTMQPVVASATVGVMTPIVQVRIDSKIDTQRRRSQSLIPARTSIANVT